MTKNIPEDDFNERELYRAPMPSAATSRNPLAGYFRIPGCHVPLPTRGAFFPEEMYDETLSGEIEIYPMKAADELLMRNPDALMSGHALEKLIESCAPSIRAPRLVSTPDLDVILLAIRASTYGDTMDIEVECPSCQHENTFECHLASIMSTMTFVPPVNEVKLSKDVSVFVRPHSLASATRAALASFNEFRALQGIEGEEELRIATNVSYERMSKINIAGLVDGIVSVVTPTSEVTERRFIAEFVDNINQAWVKKIEATISEISAMGVDKHIDAECQKCGHKWRPQVEFDPTSFFEPSS